jgi:hypothetical protein
MWVALKKTLNCPVHIKAQNGSHLLDQILIERFQVILAVVVQMDAPKVHKFIGL